MLSMWSPFLLVAALFIPATLAELEQSCESKDVQAARSLIQVRTGEAVVNASGPALSQKHAEHDETNKHISQDILMAIADETVLSAAKNGKTTVGWLYDMMTAAFKNVFGPLGSIFGFSPGDAGHKKMRFQKNKKAKKTGYSDDTPVDASILSHRLTFELLPKDLQNLGLQFFGTKQNVGVLLNNTNIANISYGGANVTVAYRKNDDVYTRFCSECPNGEEYGLDKILEQVSSADKQFEKRRKSKKGNMINMIDIGGHIGVISLAVYKKYPGQVRAVVVEPVGLSFFYLSLNLWINGVPAIPEEDKRSSPKPGITAIQKAIDAADTKEHEAMMCVPGVATKTMSAFSLDWSNQASQACNCCEEGCPDACVGAMSTNMDMIMGFFPNEDITLLKVDCEGCEAHVLNSISNPIYGKRVKKLAVEMHNQAEVVAQAACAHPSHLVRGICPASTEYLVGSKYCEVCAGGGSTAPSVAA